MPRLLTRGRKSSYCLSFLQPRPNRVSEIKKKIWRSSGGAGGMKGCCSKSFNFTPTTSSPLPPLFTNSPISLSKQTTLNPFEPSQQNLSEHSFHKHPSQLRNSASVKTWLTIGSSRIDKMKCFRNDVVPPCWLCWYAWKLSDCHR